MTTSLPMRIASLNVQKRRKVSQVRLMAMEIPTARLLSRLDQAYLYWRVKMKMVFLYPRMKKKTDISKSERKLEETDIEKNGAKTQKKNEKDDRGKNLKRKIDAVGKDGGNLKGEIIRYVALHSEY